MPPPSRVSPETLEAYCTEALMGTGMRAADARTSANILVMTDTFGVFTHGVKSLRGYVRRLRAGGLRADETPSIVEEGLGWAIVDGHSALGMVTSTFAMDLAIKKARSTGIGYAGVRNSCHFGAAGSYALQAANADMIGVAVCNDVPSVAAPGSRAGVLGTNPLAYAVPTGNNRAIFMDIATSAVAGGKVFQAQTFGRTIPPTWLLDGEGIPTTDPNGYPQKKTLMPMAAHKGYGLALLIEVLSAALTGAALTKGVGSWMGDDPARPTNHGAAFIAVNIDAILPVSVFKGIIDNLCNEIRRAPLATGAERIYLPGEMEWERRDHALKDGIDLPTDVLESLRALSEELRLPLPSALQSTPGKN